MCSSRALAMSSTSSSSARSSAVQGQPTPEVLLCELRQRLEHLRGVKRQQQAVVEHAKKISPQRCPPLPPSSSPPSRSLSSPSSSSSTSKYPSSTSAAVVLEAALSDDPTLNSAAAVLLRAMEETKTSTNAFTNAVVESSETHRAAEKQKAEAEAEAAERAAAEFARAAADVSAVFFATCDEKEDDGDRDGSKSSSHSPTTTSKSCAAAPLNPRLSSSVPSSPSTKALTKTPQAPADIVVPGGGPGRMGMTARLMRFPPRVVASRLPDRLPAASACATAMHSTSAHHAGNSVGNTCATIGGSRGVVFPHVPPRDRLTAILESRGYATTPTPSLDYFFGGPSGSSAAKSKQQSQSQPSPSPLRLASYGTAVLRSVHTSDVPALRSLLDSGLSPNPCNAFHDDILHIVAKNGDYGLFEALRDAGASYHVSDSLGRTPLHHCCWSNDEAVRRHRQAWLRQLKQQQQQQQQQQGHAHQQQQEQPFPQLDARGSLHIAHEMLRRDPTLLLLADHRGQTPLDFVPSERWAEWNDFLDSNADWLWPPRDRRRERHEEKDEEEASRRVAAMLPRDPPGALSPEEATRAAAGKTTKAAAPRIPEARAMGGAVVVHHKRKFEETATSSTAAAAAYRNGNGNGGGAADGERRAKSKSKRRTVAGRCA